MRDLEGRQQCQMCHLHGCHPSCCLVTRPAANDSGVHRQSVDSGRATVK